MVFHWSLSDRKSPQVSRTLLSILAVRNNAVAWIVSTRPPTFKSSSTFNNPLVTVQITPITIGLIVTFMLHRSFNYLARSRYLSFFSLTLSFHILSVLFCGQPGQQSQQFYWFSFYYYYYYFTPLEFFTSVLADGFSMEFEWQQVSSSLQDSSQDSGCS